MKRVLLKNGTLIGLEPLRMERSDLLIVDGRIAAKGPRLPSDRETSILDCRGRYIVPGLVNAHVRLGTSQSLGMPLFPGNLPIGANAHETALRRIEDALTPETIVTATFAAALDAVRAGTTTVFLRHSSPSAVANSLDLVRDVLLTVGIRSVVAYDVGDDGVRSATELDECLRFAGSHASDKIVGAIGTSAVASPSDATLERLVHAVRDDRRAFFFNHGRGKAGDGSSEIGRMARAGLLGPRTVATHGLFASREDRARLREHGSWIIHCPTTDAMSGRGAPEIDRFGDQIAIGTERAAQDVFGEVRAAVMQARAQNASVTTEDALRLLGGGHQLASDLLGIELGSLLREAGADLVVLNYQPRTPVREDNIAEHLVFGVGQQHIESVIIDGNLVYHLGRFPDIDIPRLTPLMQRGAQQLWSSVAAPVHSI